jgi:hypothetical protein
MNDRLSVRLRPQRSEYGPDESPPKFTGVVQLKLSVVQFQSMACFKVQNHRPAEVVK